MPCTGVRTRDGKVTGILCTRSRRKRCSVAGCKTPAAYLCDHPVAGGRTCSKAVCGHHRTAKGELDYCPTHAKAARQALELPTAPRALSLYCSVWGCDGVAVLPCDGTPDGQPCTVTVCTQHRARSAERWLCSSCAPPSLPSTPPPQQLSLL